MGPRTNKLVVVGALGISALSLIGLGASASFTDSVSATQVINTGTLCMKISSVDGNGNPDGVVSSDGKSVTFKTGPGSQVNQKHMLFVTNACSLTLNIPGVTVAASGGGLDPAPLGNDVHMDFANILGSVRALERHYNCINCQLSPGETLAVNGDIGVRFEFTADLGNADEGQTITPTVTFNAVEWDGAGPFGPGTLS